MGASRFGVSAAGIVLEDVRCNGTEDSLYSCSISQLGEINNPICTDSNRAAGVICSRTCFAGDTRIVDGPIYPQGRVEVCINNQWGTICDLGWDDFDAAVACRGFGFNYGISDR